MPEPAFQPLPSLCAAYRLVQRAAARVDGDDVRVTVSAAALDRSIGRNAIRPRVALLLVLEVHGNGPCTRRCLCERDTVFEDRGEVRVHVLLRPNRLDVGVRPGMLVQLVDGCVPDIVCGKHRAAAHVRPRRAGCGAACLHRRLMKAQLVRRQPALHLVPHDAHRHDAQQYPSTPLHIHAPGSSIDAPTHPLAGCWQMSPQHDAPLPRVQLQTRTAPVSCANFLGSVRHLRVFDMA